LGAKYLFVLCAGFTLLLGEEAPMHQQVVWRHRSVAKLARITFLSLALSYWIDYLGFITEGKLAAVLITPSLGVPNWLVIYIINTAPSPA
jgi:predicted membrane-bound spermidine synthase